MATTVHIAEDDGLPDHQSAVLLDDHADENYLEFDADELAIESTKPEEENAMDAQVSFPDDTALQLPREHEESADIAGAAPASDMLDLQAGDHYSGGDEINWDDDGTIPKHDDAVAQDQPDSTKATDIGIEASGASDIPNGHSEIDNENWDILSNAEEPGIAQQGDADELEITDGPGGSDLNNATTIDEEATPAVQERDSFHEIDYEENAEEHTGVSEELSHDSAQPDDGVNDGQNADEDMDTGHVANQKASGVGVLLGSEENEMDENDGSIPTADPQDLESQAVHDKPDENNLSEASSAASLDSRADDDADLPEGIVCWQGEEFPLFYNAPGSDGKECFFHDTFVLQCTIEELLASFRRELQSDVGDSDELVLQINEMGLEFAESHRPELFVDITLGSVLQVFNDLVRNKDPTASRPLYAYLITRPNCSKRWQALIEDAYQGKNIEEIGVYFTAEHNAPAELSDHVTEDYEEYHEGENALSMDDDSEEPPQESTSHADLANAEDFSENNEAVGFADEAFQEDGALMSLTEDVEQQGEAFDLVDPVDELGVVMSSVGDSAIVPALSEDILDVRHDAGIDVTAETAQDSEDTTGIYAFDDAPLSGDSLLTLDTAVDDPLIGEQQTVNDLLGDTAGNIASVNTGEVPVSKVTSNTSGTATPVGENEDEFNAEIDLTADVNHDDNAEDLQNDMDEIDWRDEPDPLDQASPEDSASTSAKRPRSTEDDPDAEDGQETKRRRP